MAVRADAGDNTIVFRYRTPGLTAGLLITAAGIVLLAAYLIIFRKKSPESVRKYCYDYDSYDNSD